MTRGVDFSKVTEGVCHLETRETSELSLERAARSRLDHPTPVQLLTQAFSLADLRLVGFGVGKAAFNPVKLGYGSKI